LKLKDRIGWLLIGLAVFSLVKGGGALPIVGPAATAATYVYEKDTNAVPAGVLAGLNRLNREKKITASVFEEDTRDGSGEVPDQFKAALAAATTAGLPALVVTSGETVLKIVKNPRTEEQIVGAVQ
jgi:hypothetical protein